MPFKYRPKEELEEMLRAFAGGMSISEISKKHDISEAAFYRMIKASRGETDKTVKNRESKIKKLEKTLKEREKEISLLKDILKKS